MKMCMSICANGVNCGVVEWVEKHIEWFGQVERMGSGEFVEKGYESELESPNRRERPLARLKDRVEEYLGESGINGRGVLEAARRECGDRERWRLYCCGHPLGEHSQREQGIRAIDTMEYKGSTDSNSPAGPNEAACSNTHYNYTISRRASIYSKGEGSSPPTLPSGRGQHEKVTEKHHAV